jgi:hypothetical protein
MWLKMGVHVAENGCNGIKGIMGASQVATISHL